MFLGGANYSTETMKCSWDHEKIPDSPSNILGVRVIAQRQGHHTKLDHLRGILVHVAGSHVAGWGGVRGALDLFHDTLKCSTEANIAQKPQAVHRDPQMSPGDP